MNNILRKPGSVSFNSPQIHSFLYDIVSKYNMVITLKWPIILKFLSMPQHSIGIEDSRKPQSGRLQLSTTFFNVMWSQMRPY